MLSACYWINYLHAKSCMFVRIAYALGCGDRSRTIPFYNFLFAEVTANKNIKSHKIGRATR